MVKGLRSKKVNLTNTNQTSRSINKDFIRQSSNDEDEDVIEYEPSLLDNYIYKKQHDIIERSPRKIEIRKEEKSGSSTISSLEAAIEKLKTNQQMQYKLVTTSQKDT